MPERTELMVEPSSVTMLPGETVEIKANIRNLSQTVDQLVITVEGIDPTWYTIPVSSVALFPNDQDSLSISLHPPRAAERSAGTYTLTIKVTSQEDPSHVATAEVAVELKAVLEVEVGITPENLAGRKGTYQVTINNPGDQPATVQLVASDFKNRLRYAFNMSRLTVEGGARSGASLEVGLRWLAMLGGEKTFEFKVAAMPADEIPSPAFCPYCGKGIKPKNLASRVFCPHCSQNLSEKAKVATANFIRTPLIKGLPKISFPWFTRKPVVQNFEAATEDKREFILSWSVKRAKAVMLGTESVDNEGEKSVFPDEPATYTLTASNKGKSVSQSVQVHPLPVPKETSERIRASLSPAELQVHAGTVPGQATLHLQNMGEIVDKFLIDIAGLDTSWYSTSASSVALMPQASDQVQISFQPPKKEGVRAGKYPYVIRVRSESVPEDITAVTGELHILPLPEFKLQVRPFRVTCRKKGTFRIGLSNTGVSDINFNLEATDMEEGCRFRFEDSAPAVAAWKAAEVPMRTKPKRGWFVGEKKAYNVTVTASDGTNSQTGNCELTHKPLFGSWKTVFKIIRAVVVIIIIVVIVYLAIHWGGGWSQLTSDPGRWAEELTDEWPPWKGPFDEIAGEESTHEEIPRPELEEPRPDLRDGP
ncbi:MAG: hypothetical protein R6U89_02730 [Dehalococcoidia bacterium]